jgi:ribosomal protein L19E
MSSGSVTAAHPVPHPSQAKPWLWPPGRSQNPGGVPKGGRFVDRYERKLASYVADLGYEPDAMDLELLQQAAMMATRADDLWRRMSRGKPINDEDLSRYSNGAARILLKLRGKKDRRDEPGESLQEYAARVTREKAAAE